jgi:hypothetical protein
MLNVWGFNARIFRGILILTISLWEKEFVVPASGEDGRSEFALVGELNGWGLRTPDPPHGFWRTGKTTDAIRDV